MTHIDIVMKMTTTEFEGFVRRDDNSDRRFELIAGEVLEVVSGQRSSAVAMRIGGELLVYLKQHPIGFLTGPDGGYKVGEGRFIPDVALVLYSTTAEPTDESYSDGLSLAVEVISPSDKPAHITTKVNEYVKHGIVVWLVDPQAEMVTVYIPDAETRSYYRGEVLPGTPLLPELNLAVDDIFSWPQPS